MTNIPWERSKLAAQGLKIRRREEWGSKLRWPIGDGKYASYDQDRDCQIPANDFFLHIAVIRDPGDLLGTEDQVARNIENIGINRFPNTGGSYNSLAFNTGRLYELQPLTRRGAHTVNDKRLATCPSHGGSLAAPGSPPNLNVTVRALCLPQMVDDPVTDAQIRSAAKWAAAQIRSGLAKPTARWHGHRDCAWKDCPGSAGYARIPELNSLTRYYVAVGLGSTTSTGGDMQLTDAIPGLTDPDGTPTTIGEALVRGNWAAAQIREGGAVEKRIQVSEARANWAYSAVIEGGAVDARLDVLGERDAVLTQQDAALAQRIEALENAPKDC